MMVPGPVPTPAVVVFVLLVFGLPFSCGYCSRPYIERVRINVEVSSDR